MQTAVRIAAPRAVCRHFHASQAAAFKQKNKEDSRKTYTPKKNSGEWRNFRRAASYSNFRTRAPDVSVDQDRLRLVTGDSQTAPDLTSGTMVTFPEQVQVSLSHLASFKPQQNNELFKTPASLVRAESVQLAEILRASTAEGTTKHRYLLTGPAGIGKSTLLSQAHALAKLQGWTVLHIPRAENLVDGSTDAVSDGKGGFAQHMLARRWLRRVLKANRDTLSEAAVKIVQSSSYTDAGNAVEPFLAELAAAKTPVLLSLDNINAWSETPFSKNRDLENQPVYHGSLQLPKLFLSYLSGEKTLPHGTVIAATTGAIPHHKTVNVATGKDWSHAYADISEYDPALADSLGRAMPLEVSPFSLEETGEYLQYLHSAAVGPEVSPELRDEKYAISGNGNPRALLKSCVTFSF